MGGMGPRENIWCAITEDEEMWCGKCVEDAVRWSSFKVMSMGWEVDPADYLATYYHEGKEKMVGHATVGSDGFRSGVTDYDTQCVTDLSEGELKALEKRVNYNLLPSCPDPTPPGTNSEGSDLWGYLEPNSLSKE